MEQIIKELNSANEIDNELIMRCSNRCIEKNDATTGILKLKELAKDCKSKADYVDFFHNVLKLNVEESERGMILHLGKTQCSCPIASELTVEKSRLCDCTRAHEKYLWSQFFGKEIDVEIIESFWRGGSDCVLEIQFTN